VVVHFVNGGARKESLLEEEKEGALGEKKRRNLKQPTYHFRKKRASRPKSKLIAAWGGTQPLYIRKRTKTEP